ncbi:MAG: hypothetical protein WCP29_09645 [Acidobacteriota bacterium]
MAIGILTTAVVSLAGLAAVAVRTVSATRDRTVSAAMAAQKLEQLSIAAGTLTTSPSDAASLDRAGFVEYLDAAGVVVGTSNAARGVVFVRRWAVSPLAADPDLAIIHVTVAPCRRLVQTTGACGDAAATASLATLRPRVPW